MLRTLFCLLLAFPAQAHEFWIAPQTDRIELGDQFELQVMIGERLEGQPLPFQPLAFTEAYWVGPKYADALHTRRMSGGPFKLQAKQEGLHILAVSTFPQSYTHPTGAAFDHYAETEALNSVAKSVGFEGPVREIYRRFSKSVFQIGAIVGQDRRVGLEYEWVRTRDKVTLYHYEEPVPNQRARYTCRVLDGPAVQKELSTDRNGSVSIEFESSGTCLLNAVIIRKQSDGWRSNWVSYYY